MTAILEDLPVNTHLTTEVIASGLAPYSPLSPGVPQRGYAYTYMRLSPGASGAALAKGLPAFNTRHIDTRFMMGGRLSLQLAALIDIHHLKPSEADMKAPGDRTRLLAIAGVGALIVLIAAINFVSLMSARSGRRAVEVGVRKAAGARRGQLMLQFLGKSLI